MKKREHDVYIYEDGVLQRIVYSANPDKFGHKRERWTKKENESCIGLILVAILAVLTGVTFWEMLFESMGV